MRLLRVLAISALLMVGSAPPTFSLPEVWIADSDDIERYGFDGTFLGEYLTPAANQVDIEVVGTEVWIADYDDISRYDFDGTFLGEHNTFAAGQVDMEVVGTEVWIADFDDIERYGFDGTFLGEHHTFASGQIDLEVIPEPTTALLLAAGLAGLAAAGRRS